MSAVLFSVSPADVKLHADKGYDCAHLRRWLRKRGIRHRIARKGIESSTRLGRHRSSKAIAD
ncbi:IS5 family transposase [Streptomyces sp. V1I6]|nr:IS5 family transposase [Streptomyces sp. V1I6]